MRGSPRSDDVPRRETVLTFEVQRQSYCVEAARVSSVLGIEPEETLEDAADPWYAGTVTVVDERIRVVDLPRILSGGTPPRDASPRLIVFETADDDGAYYGWLVDHVEGTRTVDAESVEPIHSGVRFLSGQLETEDGTVLWLDEMALNG